MILRRIVENLRARNGMPAHRADDSHAYRRCLVQAKKIRASIQAQLDMESS